MHGPLWLSNPLIPIILFAIAGYFLILTIRHRNDIRDVEQINGLKIFDTSKEWICFTGFIGLVAIGAHLLAEYYLHWYDVTPIDRFTHGLSGMAVTAIILNFRLTRKKRLYYPLAIAAAWIAFVLWEVFEAVFVYLNPSGFIEISTWDTAVDFWIDSLGGLSICFLCDELTTDFKIKDDKKTEQNE
jgi:hypothetical protein